MSPIAFFIAGVPKSTQTGSVVRAGTRSFPVKRNTPWSAICGLIARQHAPAEPLRGPVGVRLTFCMPRPKGATGRAYPSVRPDIDGLCKGLLDAWNGILWQDDAQVVALRLEKVYTRTARPGIQIAVRPL